MTPQSIPVDRIFLDLTNPRHKPYQSEAEVIDYLCDQEQVYTLAKDIAGIGLNPLESFAVIPVGAKKTRIASYVVGEGNRRLCAIKLLNDSDLAPAKLRKDFFKSAQNTSFSFSHLPSVVFQTPEDFHVWRDRIHGGPQQGVGRKPWNAEQKTRHAGDQKNVLAQRVLDYAEKSGFLTAVERQGKLTTAQRYLGNKLLREAIGLESASPDDISRTRPEEDFDLLLKSFVRDLVENKVHSRSDAEAIKEYSRSLTSIAGISAKRVPATSLDASPSKKHRKRPAKQPPKPKTITFEESIEQGLRRIGSYKLQALYYSMCDIPLEKHTPLISIGTWAFLETLTAWCGRTDGTSFPSFLSSERLAGLGFVGRDQKNAISGAITRLSGYGNTTKHHETSANFNGVQLSNDIDTIRELIVKLLTTTKL